jgi:Icc-related predicted phosphoesterase
MKVCIFADSHGHLPKIPKEAELLLIAGDLAPPVGYSDIISQVKFLQGVWYPWIEKLQIPVVAIAGNHDSIYELRPHLVTQGPENWTYLQDNLISLRRIVDGQELTVYGSPWTLRFYDWGFNADEEQLRQIWENIPVADVWLFHSPVYGYGDQVNGSGPHLGSVTLREQVDQKQPKYLIHGHIHSSRGIYKLGNTTIINASVVDEQYNLVHEPYLIEI